VNYIVSCHGLCSLRVGPTPLINHLSMTICWMLDQLSIRHHFNSQLIDISPRLLIDKTIAKIKWPSFFGSHYIRTCMHACTYFQSHAETKCAKGNLDFTRAMIFRISIPTVTFTVPSLIEIGVVIRLCGWLSGSNRCLSNRPSSGVELDPVK